MYAKSETTIARILEAAARLFREKNYADVSMSEIASLAQVTKGALYHHFPSKEALYLAMLHSDLDEKKKLFTRAVQMEGSCRERLRALTEAFLRLPEEKRELIKLIRRDINIFKNPTREQLVHAYQAALPELIEEIIRDGIREGELAAGDPRLLSWMYVALVEVMLSEYARNVLSEEEAILDYVVDFFFHGGGSAN